MCISCIFFFFFFLKDSLFYYHASTKENLQLSVTSLGETVFLQTWLQFKLVSQSSEGDNDLLSVQPQNNKITSLPRC